MRNWNIFLIGLAGFFSNLDDTYEELKPKIGVYVKGKSKYLDDTYEELKL